MHLLLAANNECRRTFGIGKLYTASDLPSGATPAPEAGLRVCVCVCVQISFKGLGNDAMKCAGPSIC